MFFNKRVIVVAAINSIKGEFYTYVKNHRIIANYQLSRETFINAYLIVENFKLTSLTPQA